MSTFYGQLQGSSPLLVTRCGTRSSGIRASVQSERGSVTTELHEDGGILKVRVRVSGRTKFGGDELFDGTIEELISRLR